SLGKMGGPFKQSVKLVGTLPETQVAFNPADPPAPRFDLPVGPKGASGTEVASIYSEIALPSFLPDDKADAGGDTFMPPFPAEALADYKDDDPPIAEIMKDKAKKDVREKYLFRITVMESFEIIRDLWGGANGAPNLKREFFGSATD